MMPPSCYARILPRVRSEHLYLLIEELCKNLDISIPVSYSGPSLPDLIVSLARRYAGGSFETDSVPQVIADAARYCLLVGSPDSALDIINDGLARKFSTAKPIKEYIVPLVHHLCRLGDEFNTLGKLAPAFQTIFRTWTKELRAYATLNTSISRWDCDCPECVFVRTWIKAGQAPPQLRRGANKQKREHVSDLVRQYLPRRAITVECSMNKSFTVRLVVHLYLI